MKVLAISGLICELNRGVACDFPSSGALNKKTINLRLNLEVNFYPFNWNVKVIKPSKEHNYNFFLKNFPLFCILIIDFFLEISARPRLSLIFYSAFYGPINIVTRQRTFGTLNLLYRQFVKRNSYLWENRDK